MSDSRRRQRTISLLVPTSPYFPLPAKTVEVSAPNVGHPGTMESLIPVWGSGREALADYYDGHDLQALANLGLAATDVFLVKAAAQAGLKGSFKLGQASWKATRAQLAKEGFAKPGQPVHHALIPQGRWGRAIPGEIKNSKLNLKAMQNAEVHGRIHGPYKGKPQFNGLQQFFYGTPAGLKVGVADATGHGVATVLDPKGKTK